MAKHRMAQSQHPRTDLGLYFGDEDEEQLEQEDKALSYLVLATDQDDAFDPVDTENLLAQMSAGNPSLPRSSCLFCPSNNVPYADTLDSPCPYILSSKCVGSLISHRMELDEETNVVQLLSEPNLTALEKVQLLSQSQYHFHR